MYPNPPYSFSDAARRGIDDSGEIPVTSRPTLGQPATADLWPWPHVVLGTTSAALVVTTVLDWTMDLFAPITSSKLTAGAATTFVIIVLCQSMRRHQLRVDRLIREAWKATVVGQHAVAEATERRHAANQAKLEHLTAAVDGDLLKAIESAAAHTVAVGQQVQARTAQLTARLDRIEASRAAEGEAREALDQALVAGVAEVVGKALTDFGARITAVEQANSRGKMAPRQRHRRSQRGSAVQPAEPSGPSENGKPNGESAGNIVAMPRGPVYELGKKAGRMEAERERENGSGGGSRS